MARYTGAVCRLCRREGTKLFLKGERCYTPKCAIERRNYAPGQHGQNRKKLSEYGVQLREKQKLRRIYGVAEKQFRNYFKEANRRQGVTGETLLQILESRLDNVVFRLGFATSRTEARQLVTHGHFTVNGKKVDIPSYLTKPGDVIEVKEKSKESPKFKDLREFAATQNLVSWLERDAEALRGRVLAVPSRDEIDVPVAEHLIVELYSR
ncbi:SSU ribosomal protein S4P [Anaerobranca californiensis DSM 14826]|jgi:small subunit ribosomal protein S4|uniref:Small ribosomal subunit protein uS4 n=1 Tax=Anaerobranca californiensis DSM 14826 TaxID=1120989 RepID=A0A1M6MZB5_9FIRM|nr:30S ribosomal protein S4 [Anaerobranca californiensis]SHJ88760.1 SSU ribosomal protein S4P [Anaerobranca californiensis DSM 14826]